jgi:acetylornithine deacetylase/succinyl-diaminopimelate desuccinylase-like protein
MSIKKIDEEVRVHVMVFSSMSPTPQQEIWIDELKEFLRIPSVSTTPGHATDVRRCAEFTRDLLVSAGLRNATLIEGDGHPLVYADWLDAEPDKPTVLFYGHYDVQPPDPLQEWTSPPFEPEVRGDDIFARGAADDKGQVFLQIKAVEQLMRRSGDGKLPVNVRFLIEGEEESGGEVLERFVASGDARLKADAAIVCDTEMFAPGLPTLCVGLRGIVYGEIHVQTAAVDLHSGVYGGAAPNAMQAICEVITALKDRDGRIQVEGFYDRVTEPTAAEREAWARLPFTEADYREKEVKVSALTGEPGFDVFQRTWARPTFEVHGIRGGFTGEGAKTVIPCAAVAKVSARLVPDQRPEEAVAQLQAAVRRVCPLGATAEFKLLHSAPPSVVNTGNRFIECSAVAMKQVFGKETVYIRSGGSIPVVGLFDKHLGIPSVMMGFGLPDDNLHAPNEKFHLPNLFGGIEAVARYLELLGS